MPVLLKSLLLGCAAIGFIACGDDIVGQRSCSTTAECIKVAGTVYDADAGTGIAPECCNKVCVVQTGGGCDSGYRYLTTQPGFGACVAEPMCSSEPQPDMTAPTPDLTSQD